MSHQKRSILVTNTLTSPNESLPVKWDTNQRYEEEYFHCENLTWGTSHLCILTLMYILVLRKRLTVYRQAELILEEAVSGQYGSSFISAPRCRYLRRTLVLESEGSKPVYFM